MHFFIVIRNLPCITYLKTLLEPIVYWGFLGVLSVFLFVYVFQFCTSHSDVVVRTLC